MSSPLLGGDAGDVRYRVYLLNGRQTAAPTEPVPVKTPSTCYLGTTCDWISTPTIPGSGSTTATMNTTWPQAWPPSCRIRPDGHQLITVSQPYWYRERGGG